MAAQPSPIPPMALVLTGLGAVPFIGLALVAILTKEMTQIQALEGLTAYAAVVLSFLGGIHWGFALAPGANRPPARQLLMGVVPAAAAWAATTLDGRSGFLVLALSFAAMLLLDMSAAQSGAVPRWYPRLRIPSTVLAVLAMLAAATV